MELEKVEPAVVPYTYSERGVKRLLGLGGLDAEERGDGNSKKCKR
jgi:hypothetical protein